MPLLVGDLKTFGKTDLLTEVCVNLGRKAAKAPESSVESNTESSNNEAKSENQNAYIKTYKKLLQETEKWPVLWD